MNPYPADLPVAAALFALGALCVLWFALWLYRGGK